MSDAPYVPPYIPPVNPADIPPGCYFVWNHELQRYDYPPIPAPISDQNFPEPLVNQPTTP